MGMEVSEEQPPKTPLFGHFFSAPADSKVDPPNMSQSPPISTLSLPNSNTSPSYGSTTMPDITTLLMTQIMGLSQIQTQLMRDMVGTPRRKISNSPNPGHTSYGTTCNSESITIDDSKVYPRFDEFFESLGDRTVDRDLGAILAQLSDAKVYRIHELRFFSDSELKDMGLAIGDIKWLRNEIKKAVEGGQGI